MGVEEKVKKFLGEPLLWVSMAMVGVVMMGPAAANFTRNFVAGDRDRGVVDQHGESTAVAPLVAKQDGESSDRLKPDNRMAMNDLPKSNKPGNGSGVSPRLPGAVGRDSDMTAADVLQRGDRGRSGPEGSPVQPLKGRNDAGRDANFGIDQMVSEVEAAVRESRDSSAMSDGGTAGNLGSGSSLVTNEPPESIVTPKPTSDPGNLEPSFGKLQNQKKYQLPTPPEMQSASDPDQARVAKSDSNLGLRGQQQDQEDASRMDKGTGADVSGIDNEQLALGDKEDATEPFEPWGDPLTFEPESAAKSHSHESRSGSSSANDAKGLAGGRGSVAPEESGDEWWQTMVSQQFWPNRQAQFADLDSVVFVALQRSAQLQILNDQPRIERTFVQQREADFDWSAFVDASWNSVSEPVRSELQTGSRSGRYEQEELRVGSGLQKRLARGGQLRVGSVIGTLDNNSIFLAPPDQGTSTFSLDYRQPLLRGRGREVAQSQIVLARLNVEVSEHAVKREMQQYLVDVVTAYWALYRARGVLSQRHRSVTRAAGVVQRLSKNADSDATDRQLIRAKAAAAARQSEVIDAEYVVADAQEVLMNLTHGDNLADASFIEVIPTDAPPQVSTPHDLSSVTQLAISNREEVKQVLAEIKAATVRQVIALDGLKPQLDAIISSYVAGVRGDKDVGNAIYDQFSAGDPSYSVGMAFEIPIGRRAANAGLKRQEIQSRLLQNKLRRTLGDVTLSARSAFRDVYRLTAIVSNNRQVVSQSASDLNSIERQNVWLSKDDQSAGLYLNDLLLSQERLVTAERNLLESQSQLAVAYVALKRATGELLQDHKVGCDSVGCQTCDDSECNCGTVGHVTYDEPVGRYWDQQGDAEDQGWMMERTRSMPQQHGRPSQYGEPSILLERPTPPAGVEPVPPNADTAGEWEAPSSYLESAKRLPARAAKWFRR